MSFPNEASEIRSVVLDRYKNTAHRSTVTNLVNICARPASCWPHDLPSPGEAGTVVMTPFRR